MPPGGSSSDIDAYVKAVLSFFKRFYPDIQLTEAAARKAINNGFEQGYGRDANQLVKYAVRSLAQGYNLVGGQTGQEQGSPYGDLPNVPKEGQEAGGLTKEQASRQKRQTRRNEESGFLAILQGLGIAVNKNLQQLITEASQRNYSSDTFLRYLRQTPEYRKEFPGIFRPNGELKMTEQQYLSYKSSYESIAAANGLNFGPDKAGVLFRNNVDPEEYRIKAEAEARLRQNPQLFRQFAQVTGEKPTRENLFKFITKQGPAEWTRKWNETITRYSAVRAGITISKGDKYTALGDKTLERLSKLGLSEDQMRAAFEEVSDNLLEVIPESAIQHAGLNKKDIVKATFGGKGAAEARQKLQTVLAQRDAFFEQRGAPQGYAGEGGELEFGGRGVAQRVQSQ